MSRSLLLFCLLALVVPAVATAGDAEAPFTLARFLEVPVLISPAVSPDGTQVAWLQTHRDLAADQRVTRLWLGEVAGGAVRQLTFTDARVGGVDWRPDGALSFLRAVDEVTQVFVNPLDGSEPRPVTDLPDDVQGYWWSPDGGMLAVLAVAADGEDAAAEGDEDAEDAGETAAEEAPDPRDADVFSVEGDRRDWTVWDRLEQPAEYPQLWLVTVGPDGPDPEAEPRQLTEVPWNVYHAAWSPDGRTLAVTYNPRFSSLVDEEQQLALIDVESGEVTPISPADRHASMAAFSPDGKRLAYYLDKEAEYRTYLNLKDVVVRDLASGQETVLTARTQLGIGGFGSTPGQPPAWDAKGRKLVLPVADGTKQDLYELDARTGELTALTRLAGNLTEVDLAGGTAAYIESALDKPGTLYAGKPGGKWRALATTDDAVADYGLQPARKLRLPGYDGGFVEGFLFLPPGAGDGDRLPAIIEMHGGPFSRYGNAWTTRYPWQVLSHEGFAVFIVNPRGGTAYGAQFQRGVYRNFGTDDYRDIMAAVDALVERGTIDPERLGFTGYSYGGLMTNVVVGRTDRFRAAVSIAGIWNYTSAIGQNNPQLFIDGYRRPWDEDLQRMWEHSPASRADAVTTPTLIMHGQDDEPVDPRQSIEMFSALQLNGVPSRLVLYPGEGHGINKPSHMIDYQTRELQWFRRYLLDDAEAVGAEPPLPVEP